MAKRANPDRSDKCTGEGCRNHLPPGAGIQLELPGRKKQRLCWACFDEYNKRKEAESGEAEVHEDRDAGDH